MKECEVRGDDTGSKRKLMVFGLRGSVVAYLMPKKVSSSVNDNIRIGGLEFRGDCNISFIINKMRFNRSRRRLDSQICCSVRRRISIQSFLYPYFL